ncbi:MAG: hypothetical protein ACTJHU_09155, partial [Mycetocola sp.]
HDSSNDYERQDMSSITSPAPTPPLSRNSQTTSAPHQARPAHATATDAPSTTTLTLMDGGSPRSTRGLVQSTVALSLALAGLIVAGTTAAWVAGSLGISTAAASQIVTAIDIGGAALTAVGIVFGAGIVGAIIGTVRYMLVKKARKVVVL